MPDTPLIPPHGGYKRLRTYKLGNLIYDATAAFCARKAEVAGNVMLCLINQETYLLGRQVTRLAADFETEGGFTERLYRVRTEAREKKKH